VPLSVSFARPGGSGQQELGSGEVRRPDRFLRNMVLPGRAAPTVGHCSGSTRTPDVRLTWRYDIARATLTSMIWIGLFSSSTGTGPSGTCSSSSTSSGGTRNTKRSDGSTWYLGDSRQQGLLRVIAMQPAWAGSTRCARSCYSICLQRSEGNSLWTGRAASEPETACRSLCGGLLRWCPAALGGRTSSSSELSALLRR
jgi:hypothetical protein